MSTPPLLYCQSCKVWFTAQGDRKCIDCKQEAYLTTAEAMEKWPFRLSENDKKFLRSIRVSPNNDHEDDGA